jgi:hypothetical protein
MFADITIITRQCDCGTTFETDDWSPHDHCPACEATRTAKLEEEDRITKSREDAGTIRASCERIVAAIDNETPKRILATDHDHPQWNRQLW